MRWRRPRRCSARRASRSCSRPGRRDRSSARSARTARVGGSRADGSRRAAALAHCVDTLRTMTTPEAGPPGAQDPTLEHADAAARLRVAITRLNRQLRQQSIGNLTLSQWSALVTIETHEPLRIGDLADREGVSPPTATRLVASLEDQGLVSRTVDASDRRSAYVSLTP